MPLPERIKSIGSLIKKRAKNEQLTIVFSAFGGVTDQLISAATAASNGDQSYNDIISEIRNRHLDAIHQLVPASDTQSAKDHINKNFTTLSDLLKGVFLVREASPRTMDYVLSFGEQNSNYIISSYFNSLGIKSQYTDARQLVKTNKDFGAAKVNVGRTEQLIKAYYSEHEDSVNICLLYTSPSPRDRQKSRMPSSA